MWEKAHNNTLVMWCENATELETPSSQGLPVALTLFQCRRPSPDGRTHSELNVGGESYLETAELLWF